MKSAIENSILLDFIILGSHGSGLNAMQKYLNQCDVCQVLPHNGQNSLHHVEPFLQQYTGTRGMFVDKAFSGPRAANDLDKLLAYCRRGYTLVVTTRDPLEQILSVINTHIRWWADASIGLSIMPITSLLLYQSMSVAGLCNKMLESNIMWAVQQLLPHMAEKAGQVFVIAINELHPPQIEHTLLKMFNTMGIDVRQHAWSINMPNSLVYSQINRFVGKVPKLACSGPMDFTLDPCPEEFCDLLDRNKALMLCYEPEEIGFTLGNFNGRIGFECSREEINASGLTENAFLKIVKDTVEADDLHVLRAYASNLSQRHTTALSVFEHLKVTGDKILADSYGRGVLMSFKKYVAGYMDTVIKHRPDVVASWSTSRSFLRQCS